MSNLFIQMHLGAIEKAGSAYVAAGLENQNALLGGLIRLWASAWSKKSLATSAMQVCAFFYRNHREPDGSTLMEALVEYGFLTINPDSTLMVRDDKDRLGITKSQNRAKGAEKSRAKKTEHAPTPQKPNAKTRNQASINVDGALMEAEHSAASTPQSTLMQAPIYSETHRLIEDHNLLGGLGGAPFPAAAESEFQAGEAQAAAVLSGRTGDHAAREVNGFKTPGQLARGQDFATRLTAVLRANTPPEPPAGPPLSEQAPPNTSPATPPAAPPINEIRPSTEAPEQLPASPGQEEGADDLEQQMEAIHQRVRGRSYPWKDIDRDILVELQLEGFTAQNITDWWEGALGDAGRRMRYLRELKLLMLKEARPEPPKPNPRRFDADDGIMRGGP